VPAPLSPILPIFDLENLSHPKNSSPHPSVHLQLLRFSVFYNGDASRTAIAESEVIEVPIEVRELPHVG